MEHVLIRNQAMTVENVPMDCFASQGILSYQIFPELVLIMKIDIDYIYYNKFLPSEKNINAVDWTNEINSIHHVPLTIMLKNQ